MGRGDEREGFDDDQLAVAAKLRDWDPIGVYDEPDPNPDPTEYDDLVVLIVDHLRSGAQLEDFTHFLVDRFATEYGVPHPWQIDRFCSNLICWGSSGRPVGKSRRYRSADSSRGAHP